jgi:hypothetical protein
MVVWLSLAIEVLSCFAFSMLVGAKQATRGSVRNARVGSDL